MFPVTLTSCCIAPIYHFLITGPERTTNKFGEAVALYFTFLASYTKFLTFIAAAGVGFFFIGTPYSSLYSSILLVWSVTFVEWWRIKQRLISVRWGTRGSFRVEKRRAQYTPIVWWKRELRILASLPVILFFATVLAVLLTAIFVFEAFVTQLYKGPGVKFIVSSCLSFHFHDRTSFGVSEFTESDTVVL